SVVYKLSKAMNGRVSVPFVGFLWLCVWAAVGESKYMAYKDPRQPIVVRINDLMARMTLEEKIGQMTQIDRVSATPEILKECSIGSLLSGGGSVPLPHATAEDWINMVNGFQNASLSSRLGIPMIYGIDAVHGHNNVYKATIFPHNVGLGATRQVHTYTILFYIDLSSTQTSADYTEKLEECVKEKSDAYDAFNSFIKLALLDCIAKAYDLSLLGPKYDEFCCCRDPDLVKRIGAATAIETRATGIPYVFAPCIAVCRDPRWGRCYESYSEDHKIVQQMTDIIDGLQGEIPANEPKGVPYLGGNIHMPAYYNAIIKGVSTVMVSYSSLNGVKMHANKELVTGFLKGDLKFRGFVISDWQGIDKITDPQPHANYTHSVQLGIQAGIDMVMVPFNHTEFIDALTSLVDDKIIPMSRIDDAVRRILRVKFRMGLFENPLADFSFVHHLGSQAHRDLAREAVRKSLVLLKNGENADSPLLPLPKKASRILVARSHANNLGHQCGGWTIAWQGLDGNNLTSGTTILNGISAAVDPSTEIMYSENPDADFVESNNFSYAIVVVGEPSYAETAGDNVNLTIPEPGADTITNVCGSVKCAVVLVSGRPLVVEPYLSSMDALVAAWLPGSEGQGVADVLFGDYGFSGKLSRTWFKTVDQLPMNVGDSHYDPLFPFGFGLTTKAVGAS
ncbi:hypothetical protein RJ639_029912, partial [Escallonia herrerae]